MLFLSLRRAVAAFQTHSRPRFPRGCVTLFLPSPAEGPKAAAAGADTTTPQPSPPPLKLTVTTETTRRFCCYLQLHRSRPGSRQQRWQITESRNNCRATVPPCSWGRAKGTGQLLEAPGRSQRQATNGISYSSPTGIEMYCFYLAIKNLHCFFFSQGKKVSLCSFWIFRCDRKLKIFPGKCYNKHLFYSQSLPC